MREHITNAAELKRVSGDWGVWHRYTHGVAGEKFFRALRDKRELTASECPTCKRTFLPANLYCEDCFVELTATRPVAGVGVVASFTVLHESLDEAPLEEPLVAAFVQFEGVTGGLLAPLKGVKPDQVRIGLKVKPAFAPQPTGAITDLAFGPA
jgi:hypothetical protein